MDSVKIVDDINNILRARAGTNGQKGVKSVAESVGRCDELRIGKSDMINWAKPIQLLSTCEPA
jgi:hypothetical protein